MDQLPEPECRKIPLNLSADLFASGANGALRRPIPVVTSSTNLLDPKNVRLQPRWRPSFEKVSTFVLTFPDGIDFLPVREEKDKEKTDSASKQSAETILPDDLPDVTEADLVDGDVLDDNAAAEDELANNENNDKAEKEKTCTRIQPPKDAMSLEDRLFYLLQPPLEQWFEGHELIMPFEPFPYQYEGIAWLFAQKSALLADEMGLGKTMQSITALRLLFRAGQLNRVLLICPKPLIPNWQREFKMWAEELPVAVVQGDANRRKMMWTMPNMPILIANYELVARDFEAMPEEEHPKFDLVILDEAQRIKNRDSRTSQIARGLIRKRSWALTGTPIENRPEELASLFEFLEVIPPNGSPDLRQLSRLADDYILRRTKDLVMTDLPPRLDRDEYLDLTSAQKYTYEIAEKEGIIQLNDMGDSISIQHVFELVLRLKQITNCDPLTGESAKLDRLVADMEEITASGGKAILFSQWTRTIDWIKKNIDEKVPNSGALVYHGGVPTKKREPILDQFKNDPNSHLLLMSYGTGAVGLNLQFAGYVFLFDRWWNPAVEDQAINRAHRIGATASQIIVTKFISKDTIEERIDRVLQQKRELFAAVLGDSDDTNASLSMSATEIFGLFDLKAHSKKGPRSIGPKPIETDAAA